MPSIIEIKSKICGTFASGCAVGVVALAQVSNIVSAADIVFNWTQGTRAAGPGQKRLSEQLETEQERKHVKLIAYESGFHGYMSM